MLPVTTFQIKCFPTQNYLTVYEAETTKQIKQAQSKNTIFYIYEKS